MTGDRGSAAVELPLGLGVLVVPIAVVLMVLPGLVEHRAVARSAAAEAARVVVLGDGSPASMAAAMGVAFDALDGYDEVVVRLCGGSACALVRGGLVEVTVRVRTRDVDVPLVGSIASFPITVTHREQVDAYRSLP